MEKFENYLILISKIQKVMSGELEVSEKLLDDIKKLFFDVPPSKAKEIAYILSYICLKYDVGDFWFFANVLRKTVWFNKIMGAAALFAFKRGRKFDVFISSGLENADELELGLRSLAYIFLAESLTNIDFSLAKEIVEKAIEVVKFAFDDVISGVVSTLSRMCLKSDQSCMSEVKIAVDNLIKREKLPTFEKVDILTYVSELAVTNFTDYSEELLDEAIDYYGDIVDPELRGLALIMIQKALLKLGRIDKVRLKKYEKHESQDIRRTVKIIEKLMEKKS